jgi:hypothetical protein
LEANEHGQVQVFCLQTNCVFGWASERWVRAMLLFGLTIGVVCFAGFNYAVQHISPIIFSSVALVDPAVTGIISYVAGLEGMPDLMTVLGGLVVVGGVAVISTGERQRVKEDELTAMNADHADPESGGVLLSSPSHDSNSLHSSPRRAFKSPRSNLTFSSLLLSSRPLMKHFGRWMEKNSYSGSASDYVVVPNMDDTLHGGMQDIIHVAAVACES